MLCSTLLAVFAFVAQASALNIILTNDDGIESANTRALYYQLKKAGNKVLFAASIENESGQSSAVLFPTGNLTAAGEFGIIPAGGLPYGVDANDSAIHYFNSTPSLITSFAIRHLAPAFFQNMTNGSSTGVDLVVSGPNFGANLGPQTFSVSGTVGASIASVHLGVPAIALSAFEGAQRSFTTLNLTNTTDPANIVAALSVKLINSVIHSSQRPLLPVGTGLSVNFPPVTCQPGGPTKFVATKISGNATGFGLGDPILAAEDTYNLPANGGNACLNTNCTLPGETAIASNATCQISVSVFSALFDAPGVQQTAALKSAFFEL